MFTLFLLIAGIELFFQGPVIVGIPVLADTQLPQGALAVGIIYSAYAVGALLGAVLAGALPVPKRHLGRILVSTYILSGLLIMPFGFMKATWLVAGLVWQKRHGRIHQHHLYDLVAGPGTAQN